MARSPFRHSALRDTHWVGKGTTVWWAVAAIVAAGVVAVFRNAA